MAGEQGGDSEPPELPQRADQRIEAAVVDVLKQNFAAKKDHVAGKQGLPAALLQQQGDVAVRMARRVEDRQPQAADVDRRTLLELVVDRDRLQAVVGRVNSSLFGDVQ